MNNEETRLTNSAFSFYLNVFRRPKTQDASLGLLCEAAPIQPYSSSTDHQTGVSMARKRYREDSEDASFSDDGGPPPTKNERRARASPASASPSESASTLTSATPSFTTLSGLNGHRQESARKIATATCRVMLGLGSKQQVLNKNIIAKILEAENEKGTGIQFRKNILPLLTELAADTFNYKVVELPSKKSLSSAFGQGKSNPDDAVHSMKFSASDEFVLVNDLPSSLRALNYSFLAEYTKPINKDMKAMEEPKQRAPQTKIYGENLPRPTTAIVQDGIKLLIICVVLLHGNNILQSDLITILKKNFGLHYKEKEHVSILGNQTLNDFLTMLSRQDYLERTLIVTSSGSSGATQRMVNSKNAKLDDNTLMVKLGRRCMVEWSLEQFVNLFRQIMQDQWTEQMLESAVFTVNSVWKEYTAGN
jgi:hypothetical protein